MWFWGVIGQGAQECGNRGGHGACGQGFGLVRCEIIWRECGEECEALVFDRLWQGQDARGGEQFHQAVEAVEVAKGVHLEGQQIGIVLPALAIVEFDCVLARAGTSVGGAAFEPAIFEVRMDGAVVAGQIWAGGACGFVDGEGIACVQGQRHAAQGCAGAAIWGQVRYVCGA